MKTLQANLFRRSDEPFRGVFYEFGHYRIYESGMHYKVEWAGEWLNNAPYFMDAVEVCKRHSEAREAQ